MVHWQAKAGTISIGIDIGWSKKSKSCALALRGCEPDAMPTSWWRYAPKAGAESIHVGLFRLDELLKFLPDFLTQLQGRVKDMVVVVDGPVGPDGPPIANRYVDSAFGRAQFNRRMQPSAVTSKDGPKYVAVTRQVIGKFFDAVGDKFLPPWPFSGVKGQFVYAETHPTVGLALLVPQQAVESLPSRNRPLRSPEKTFRAKSDWYWRIGARERVADALQAQVNLETHHERVAGLYCLAIAENLARHLESPLPTVAAVGGDDGVYVIMSDVAANWEVPVRDIGVRSGGLRPQAAFSSELPQVYPVRILTPAMSDKRSSVDDLDKHPIPGLEPETVRVVNDSDDMEFKGDRQLLVLSDNGGIWETQNDWLVDLDEPVCLKTLDSKQEVVILKRASGGLNSGQWVSVNKNQTPLELAKARGYQGKHLKKDDSVAIDVELLDCSDEP